MILPGFYEDLIRILLLSTMILLRICFDLIRSPFDLVCFPVGFHVIRKEVLGGPRTSQAFL